MDKFAKDTSKKFENKYCENSNLEAGNEITATIIKGRNYYTRN